MNDESKRLGQMINAIREMLDLDPLPLQRGEGRRHKTQEERFSSINSSPWPDFRAKPPRNHK